MGLNARSASATLVAHYNMNESSGSLADSASGLTMDPQNPTAFSYSQSSVPAGTYGAITVTPAIAAAFGTSISSNADTSNGSPTFQNTVSNSALDQLNSATGFTVMAWVNPGDGRNGNARVLSGLSSGGGSWGYGVNDSGQIFTTYHITDYGQPSGTGVTNGTWQHVAVTYSASGGTGTATYYLNGQEVASTQGGDFNTDSSSPFGLFGQPGTGIDVLPGAMDEVKAFSGILSESQIAAEAVNVGTPEPASLSLVSIAGAGLLLRRRRVQA